MFPMFRRDGQRPSQPDQTQDVAQVQDSAEESTGNLAPEPGDSERIEAAALPSDRSEEPGDGEAPDAPLPLGGVPQDPVPMSDSPAFLETPAEADFVENPPKAAGAEHPGEAQDGPVPHAEPYEEALPPRPRRRRRGTRRRLASPEEQADGKRQTFTAEQRLLLLDTWQRSGLPAKDFAPLIGISKHTLYKWKQLFEEQGPAGLADQPKGARTGSRLPEVTKRTILMLKQQHPEWGCQRISDMLVRGPGLPASASAVSRVLKEAGYEVVEHPTRRHPAKQTRFERAKPNQLWQTDLFTFVLKRQNRRVYLVAFLDDHSRFIVSFGLHASASTALVLEALEAGISAWGPPEEILTDNGPQYITWRGKSQFSRHLEQRGVKQIVARPRRPQTLGKIERFWGTMWREFLEAAIFQDLSDARIRIGHFIDYYNLQRCHGGIEGLVPADRFFGAAPDVLHTLKERARANALELARHGQPKRPFYVTGQMDGQSFSVHAEGERLVLKKEGEVRQEVELAGPSPPETTPSTPLPESLCPHREPADGEGEPANAEPPAPGESRLDEQRLGRGLGQEEEDATSEAANSNTSSEAEGGEA